MFGCKCTGKNRKSCWCFFTENSINHRPRIKFNPLFSCVLNLIFDTFTLLRISRSNSQSIYAYETAPLGRITFSNTKHLRRRRRRRLVMNQTRVVRTNTSNTNTFIRAGALTPFCHTLSHTADYSSLTGTLLFILLFFRLDFLLSGESYRFPFSKSVEAHPTSPRHDTLGRDSLTHK